MEALDAIRTRRSVRRYSNETVSNELITILLRAAMAAPSAGNQQPWRFVVVQDPNQLEAVAAQEPHGGMIAQAPLAVAVCADMRSVDHEGFWIQDCAAATQNLLLAAHALGLGGVWVGTYPREERVKGVGSVLGLPQHVIAFAVVAIGHPAERPSPVERFDPEYVHTDRYEERG